jgi:hypothetical protein
MILDDAIKRLRDHPASAEIKTVKMSDEEARLSVYAPGDMERIKVATFTPVQSVRAGYSGVRV